LLRRCLERDRKKRLRDIGDARLELDEPTGTAPAVTRVQRPPAVFWLLAGAIGGALIALAWYRLVPGPAIQAPASCWTAILPGSAVWDVAISRDGKHLVYAGLTAGAESLMIRTMDRQDAKPLAGTAAAVGPVFSPDGQRIAFLRGRKARKGCRERGRTCFAVIGRRGQFVKCARITPKQRASRVEKRRYE